MTEHVFYNSDDFTAEESTRKNKLAVAVLQDGLKLCKMCGYEDDKKPPFFSNCESKNAYDATRRKEVRR